MPVLSAARLLLSWVEILACRARPSHHWNGPLNALKRWIDDIKSTNRSQSHEHQTKHWSQNSRRERTSERQCFASRPNGRQARVIFVPTLLGRSEAPHPSTGKISWSGEDEGRVECHWTLTKLLHPDEKLRDAVDLIVIGAIRL